MIKTPFFWIVSVLVFSNNVFAASAHGSSGVPNVVYWQILNVTLLVVFAVYYGRKPISNFFSQRQRTYDDKLEQAMRAQTEAQNKLKQIQSELAQLEAQKEEKLKDAEKEAQKIYENIIFSAKENAEKIQKEVQISLELEVKKSVADLKSDLVEQVIELSAKEVSKDLNSQSRKSFQKDLIDSVNKSEVLTSVLSLNRGVK